MKRSTNIENISITGMYVSLSKGDYAVIRNDMELFGGNAETHDEEHRFTINKFLNRVFLNLCKGQKINQEVPKKRKNHTSLGINIKINKEIIQIMKKAGVYSNNAYPADLSAYYAYFISEYCRKSPSEREEIFYSGMIQEIKETIKMEMVINVYRNKQAQNGEDKYNTIIPYALKLSEENGHYYLAGFELNRKKERYFYTSLRCIPIRKIIPFSKETRLEHIPEIIPEKHIAFKKNSCVQSYTQMKEYMEERLASDGILYLGDILRDVRVRLSEKGKKYLSSHTQYRPFDITFDSDDSSIIRFKATKLQNFLYFFKFGGEAEILEPQKYRDDFIEKYREVIRKYPEIFEK